MGLFDRFRKKSISQERISQIQELMEKNPEEKQVQDLSKTETTLKTQRDAEVQAEMQGFVNQLSLKLADWWGIPKEEIKDKIPKIILYESDESKMAYYNSKLNSIIFSKKMLLEKSSSGFAGWKATLGEEVGHFIETLVKEDRPIRHSEFFATLSRLFISEQVPGTFKKEYEEYIKVSTGFKEMFREFLKKEYSLSKEIDAMPIENTKDLEKLIKDRENVTYELNHIYQYPAAALYFYIRSLSPAERGELLKLEPTELAKGVLYDGIKGLEVINKKINERLEKSLPNERFQQYLGSVMLTEEEQKNFGLEKLRDLVFQEANKGIENVGTFYERTEKAARERAPISIHDKTAVIIPLNKETITTPEDLKSLEGQMQSIVYGISAKLADWWNIPRTQISDSIPTVKIITKDNPEYEEYHTAAYSHENVILINEDFAKANETNKIELFKSLYPVLAEEVSHSLYYFITKTMGTGFSKFNTEFFGMMSRLYIAQEFNTIKFHREYAEYLSLSTAFSKEKEEIEIEEEKARNSQNSKDPEIAREAIETIKYLLDEKSHLYYYPAASYYFEVRKLKPEQRFELLNMGLSEIQKRIIEPQVTALNKMREMTESEIGAIAEKRFQRDELGQVKEESLKSYPESAGFFQRAASEIGKAAYGRVAGAVAAKLEKQEPVLETGEEYPQEDEYEEPAEEEEYQETQEAQEEEQPEEGQEEQYGPESEQVPPPQINISIPEKVTKDVAKKLESMGVKLPKKMIK